jgi:hypothetical protein
MANYKRMCVSCKKEVEINVDSNLVRIWIDLPKEDRPYIQEAFPEVSPSGRELILSGICEACFDDLFKEEE